MRTLITIALYLQIGKRAPLCLLPRYLTTDLVQILMSCGSTFDQSNSFCPLDLGLKCKGFRMGHVNIQDISKKTDQVCLLLKLNKNEIHVLGLSETKLNAIHPDSAFKINGFQKPF